MTARTERFLHVGQLVAGSWFILAFIAMFFSHQHPAIAAFATWTFRIYFGAFLLLLLGGVIAILVAGARNVIELYRTMMSIRPMGFVGRVFWAVVFIVSFIIALAFIRL